MQSTEKLLSIHDLHKHFPISGSSFFGSKKKFVRANNGITLTVYRGETLGLVGESGCGKSTFGRTLLQLYRQNAGSTLYYGRTLAEVAPVYVEKSLQNAPRLLKHCQNRLGKVTGIELASAKAELPLPRKRIF